MFPTGYKQHFGPLEICSARHSCKNGTTNWFLIPISRK